MSCSHLEGRNGCEVSVNEKYDYMVVNSIKYCPFILCSMGQPGEPLADEL